MKMDHYRSFADLLAHEQEGISYQLVAEQRPGPYLIMAPHGGGIEPGTSEIAARIAGNEHSLFCFRGIKDTGNGTLHITSTRYSLPKAREMVAQCQTVLSIHGCDDGEAVQVGGLDQLLAERIRHGLEMAGFPAQMAEVGTLAGADLLNITNAGHSGRGVQIEIPRQLRGQMFQSLDREGRRLSTERFEAFCDAVTSTLEAI